MSTVSKTLTFEFPSEAVAEVALTELAEHFSYKAKIIGQVEEQRDVLDEEGNVTGTETVSVSAEIDNPVSRDDHIRSSIGKMLKSIIRERVVSKQTKAITLAVEDQLSATVVK